MSDEEAAAGAMARGRCCAPRDACSPSSNGSSPTAPMQANGSPKPQDPRGVEIVRRLSDHIGFVVLPKRWTVNRRTMLPLWALNGRRLLTVRARGSHGLSRGSRGMRVNLSQANQSHRKF